MYFKSITSYDNIVYSVDMLRLKTYLDYSSYSNLDYLIRTMYKDKINSYWISDKISQFKYNYTVQINDGVLYIGFNHNQEKAIDNHGLYNLTIEFNPNKCKNDFLIFHIINLSGNWFIRSYDIAMDLRINILDLIVDKQRKRKMKIFSNGGDNLTYEVGTGDKRLKIYNKKKESNLEIDYCLTRVEITRQLDDFPVSRIKVYNYAVEDLPEIYINNYMVSLFDYKDMDKTLLALNFAVSSGYPLNQLSRAYREKLKKMYEGGHKIRFTAKDVNQIFKQVIFAYFVDNLKIRWL